MVRAPAPKATKVGVGGTRISGILVRALEIFCPHTLIAESIKKSLAIPWLQQTSTSRPTIHDNWYEHTPFPLPRSASPSGTLCARF